MSKSKTLLALGLLLMLSGCETTRTAGMSPSTPLPPSTKAPTPTSATKPLLCSEMQIVQLSRKDTDGTKLQVERNNHILSALCGFQ